MTGALVTGPGAGWNHQPIVSAPPAAPPVLDDPTWLLYTGLFASRLGYTPDQGLLGYVRSELRRKGCTADQFARGCDVLLGRALYGSFPGATEILDAAREGQSDRHVPDAEATQRLIATWQAPPPSDDVLAEAGAFWRDHLRANDCFPPAPTGARKAFALAKQPMEASPWRYALPVPRRAPVTIPAREIAPAPPKPRPLRGLLATVMEPVVSTRAATHADRGGAP